MSDYDEHDQDTPEDRFAGIMSDESIESYADQLKLLKFLKNINRIALAALSIYIAINFGILWGIATFIATMVTQKISNFILLMAYDNIVRQNPMDVVRNAIRGGWVIEVSETLVLVLAGYVTSAWF